MAVTKHLKALILAVVAFALTVTGVVIAATDSNPSSLATDPLVLHGYPPKTADLHLTVSTGSSASLNANVNVNFTDNRVDAVVQFPLVVTTASVQLLLAKNHLYARTAAASSGTWFSFPLSTPALFGLALELTKPDINLISGFTSETVSTSGYSTTRVFYRRDVPLSSLFGASTTTSALGSLRWSITVGSQGEVSATSLTVKTKSTTTTLSLDVLSYNQPAKIEVPTKNVVSPLSSAALQRLLKTDGLSKFLIPKSIASPGPDECELNGR